MRTKVKFTEEINGDFAIKSKAKKPNRVDLFAVLIQGTYLLSSWSACEDKEKYKKRVQVRGGVSGT